MTMRFPFKDTEMTYNFGLEINETDETLDLVTYNSDGSTGVLAFLNLIDLYEALKKFKPK